MSRPITMYDRYLKHGPSRFWLCCFSAAGHESIAVLSGEGWEVLSGEMQNGKPMALRMNTIMYRS